MFYTHLLMSTKPQGGVNIISFDNNICFVLVIGLVLFTNIVHFIETIVLVLVGQKPTQIWSFEPDNI